MAMPKSHKDTVLEVSLVTSINSPSSLRRKSLHVQNVATPILSNNNDEAERLARRREMDVSLTLKENINANNKRRSLGLGFLAQLSAPEMKDRISECIKLNTENKINMKNAFSLQIIDLMTYMIKKQDTNMTNLQVASTSLQVSTKIYGFRVDGVYTEIMKMAGGLDKPENESTSDNLMDGQDSEQNETENPQRKSKQKKRKHKQKIFSTIEHLKGNVEVVKPTLWIMENEDSQTMDALYQVMQSSNANSKFYLQLYNGVTVDTIEHKTSSNFGEVAIPQTEKFDEQEICPSLANFEFQGWRYDSEAQNENTPPKNKNENKFQFDMNASLPSDGEDDVVPDNVNYLDIQDAEENVEEYVETQKPVERIVDLCKVVSNSDVNKTSEYSFLQRNINVHWAGPTHWRISNFPKVLGASKIVGTCQQEPGRKRREIELCYDDSKREAVLAKFVASKAAKLDSTKLDWHEAMVSLPRDMHYNIANATKLYHHKLIDINTEKNDLNTTHVSDIVDDYDYNNENDTSNYCPNVLNEDYGISEENNETACNFETEDIRTEAQMEFTGNNLVAVQKLTNKVSIAYNTRAKRIDMRQLKNSIWRRLTMNNDTENTNTQNILHQEEENQMKEDRCFSEIYKALPNMLTKTNIEALSFPISFVSLLHLANERTLNIQSLPDMSDLIIKAD